MREGKPRKLGNYVYDVAPAGAGDGKHDHVVFETDAPARIVFNDHRRFGLMTLVATDTAGRRQIIRGHRRRAAVGRIQRGLSGEGAGRARRRRSNRPCWTSGVVAGLGNIYVCEALFRAGISPKRLAGSLKHERIAPLVRRSRRC